VLKIADSKVETEAGFLELTLRFDGDVAERVLADLAAWTAHVAMAEQQGGWLKRAN